MQIRIKRICDHLICLTASADEQLACIKDASFHPTTSFKDPLMQLWHKIKLLPTLFLHNAVNIALTLTVFVNKHIFFYFSADNGGEYVILFVICFVHMSTKLLGKLQMVDAGHVVKGS